MGTIYIVCLRSDIDQIPSLIAHQITPQYAMCNWNDLPVVAEEKEYKLKCSLF